jgi:hypothetical protein
MTKTIITILDDLTPEQEAQVVHFLDNYVTTQFIVTREYPTTKESTDAAK